MSSKYVDSFLKLDTIFQNPKNELKILFELCAVIKIFKKNYTTLLG